MHRNSTRERKALDSTAVVVKLQRVAVDERVLVGSLRRGFVADQLGRDVALVMSAGRPDYDHDTGALPGVRLGSHPDRHVMLSRKRQSAAHTLRARAPRNM